MATVVVPALVARPACEFSEKRSADATLQPRERKSNEPNNLVNGG